MAAAKMPMAKMPMAEAVFGKGGSEPPEAEEEEEIPEDFEAYAIEAFPDLEADPARIAALKHAIESCVRGYKGKA